MEINLIQIGNSKGIILPKSLLKQFRLQNKINLEIEDNRILLEPIKNKPRQNWENAFKEMSKNNDDQLLIDDSIDIDFEEWQW